MSNQAIMAFGDGAAQAVEEAFDGLKVRDGEALALVYMFMFKDPNGETYPGFRPGYIATVWPLSSISSEWLTAQLPDGRDLRFLPRTGWGDGGAFTIDVLDAAYHTFSVTRD